MRLAKVSLRAEEAGDLGFLRELHHAVREQEPGFRHLLPDERHRLLDEQFELQRRGYRKDFPQAWFTIVTIDGKPVGRLCVAAMADHLRVVDLALMPEARGHGIGRQLLQNILAEGQRRGLPVRLSVMHGNPAQGFYERLGFRMTGGTDTHAQMEWPPVTGG